MGLRGDVGELRRYAAALRAFPAELASRAAEQAAPALTGVVGADYDAGRTAFGDTRPKGVGGATLDLVESGATRAQLRFVKVARFSIRCDLGTPWAKYLIGKYRIVPNGNTAIPPAWRALLDQILAAQEGPAP